MKPMCGFVLFWIAVGMTITFLLTNRLLAIVIIAICFILGFNLFCCIYTTKRMIGFILFLIAGGMAIMLFLHHFFLALFIIILCFFLGWKLFCC